MPDTQLVITEKSFERHQTVKRLCGEIEKNFLELGEELFWIENDKDYLNLGHPTFNSYLADPDITIGRTMAFMAKEVYRVYVLGLEYESSTVELIQAGVSKLYLVKDEVDGENAWDWINDCCALSRSDIKRKLGKYVPGDSGDRRNGRFGSSKSFTFSLPIFTQDRMQNISRHAVMNSYPQADDEMQDELTRFSTGLLEQNISAKSIVRLWEPRFRRLWRMFRGWKKIALRAEDQVVQLTEENARMFNEIVELHKKLDDYENPLPDKHKWMENY